MATRLLWEPSFSGWLAGDSYGTGRSRAQEKLRKFQELIPSSQLPREVLENSDCCFHGLSVPMVASHGNISKPTVSRAWSFLWLWGERTLSAST